MGQVTGGQQGRPPKHVPVRTCVGCRQAFPKRELVRIVHTGEGGPQVDASGRLPGRGAYLCRTAACRANKIRCKALAGALRAEISSEVCKQLEAALTAHLRLEPEN